jgi:Ni/Co efflux regulator RcnB
MHPAAAAPQSSAATRPARTVPVGSTPTHANASAYTAAANAPGWNTGWRGDTRYDWVGWRARHRTLFHPGFYYPPSGGYGYAPVGAGALLASAFLSEQYWIDDPSIYHLPPASDPYRWVRYYNDILLVDIDTGEVVDVVPDVFW